MNRASRLKTLVRLRIPGALPYFFGGLRISSGLALIGGHAYSAPYEDVKLKGK